jgi:hypothetical protein
MMSSIGHEKWRRAFTVVAVLFCAVKLLFLLHSVVRSLYIADEYRTAYESIHIPDGFYRGYEPFKTVLYAYVYDVARLVTHGSNSLMRAARLETLLAVMVMLALLWVACRALTMTTNEVLFAFCVLFSVSDFMEHVFTIRADSIELLAIVAAFAVLCRGNVLSHRRQFVAGILLGLAFLTTQKAAYACFAAGVAIVVAVFLTARVRDVVMAGAACLSGFALALAVYVIAFGGPHVFTAMIGPAAEFGLHGGRAYPTIRTFVWRTLSRNAVAYLLCAIGMIVAASRWRTSSPQRRLALVFSAIFAGLLFAHTQPWPYIFAAAAVFLAIWAGDTLRALGDRRDQFGVLAIAILALSFVRNVQRLAYDNRDQIAVAAGAERLLGPSDRYQDGTAMVTTRRLAGDEWWDAINVAAFKDEIARHDYHRLYGIVREQPKLWIVNYRTEALAHELKPIINHSYVRIDPNILLTGSPLLAADTIFANHWRGDYAVFGANGEARGTPVVIDGRLVGTPVRLDLRIYRVRLTAPSSSPLALLPAGSKLLHVAPVRGPARPSFAGSYD